MIMPRVCSCPFITKFPEHISLSHAVCSNNSQLSKYTCSCWNLNFSCLSAMRSTAWKRGATLCDTPPNYSCFLNFNRRFYVHAATVRDCWKPKNDFFSIRWHEYFFFLRSKNKREKDFKKKIYIQRANGWIVERKLTMQRASAGWIDSTMKRTSTATKKKDLKIPLETKANQRNYGNSRKLFRLSISLVRRVGIPWTFFFTIFYIYFSVVIEKNMAAEQKVGMKVALITVPATRTTCTHRVWTSKKNSNNISFHPMNVYKKTHVNLRKQKGPNWRWKKKRGFFTFIRTNFL